MSLNDRFRTDAEAELEGVTIEYRNTAGEVMAWFKCRRPGGRNTAYLKAVNRQLAERRQDLASGNAEVEREIMARVWHEAVLVDWGGDIEGPNGEVPPELTEDNVVWLFCEDCPDLFEDLQTRLSSRAKFRQDSQEAALGNS